MSLTSLFRSVKENRSQYEIPTGLDPSKVSLFMWTGYTLEKRHPVGCAMATCEEKNGVITNEIWKTSQMAGSNVVIQEAKPLLGTELLFINSRDKSEFNEASDCFYLFKEDLIQFVRSLPCAAEPQSESQVREAVGHQVVEDVLAMTSALAKAMFADGFGQDKNPVGNE